MPVPLLKRIPAFGIVLVVLAACGGGGSGGGTPTSNDGTRAALGNAALVERYGFTLSDAGADSSRLRLRSTFGRGDTSDVIVDFRIEPAVGTYSFEEGTLVYENAAIAVTTTFGSIVVDIIEPLVLGRGDIPDDVTFTADISLEGHVEITIANALVTMDRGGLRVTLPFDEFESLIATPLTTPLWQHQSSMAWAVLDLLRNLVAATADALPLINDALAASTAITENCDAFPSAPPAGALARGAATLTWLGSGTISTGDRFTRDFTSCWIDTGTARTGMLEGRMRLEGLVRTTAGSSITQIGFRTLEGLPMGGIFFDDLRLIAIRTTTTGHVAFAPHDYMLGNGLRITFDAR